MFKTSISRFFHYFENRLMSVASDYITILVEPIDSICKHWLFQCTVLYYGYLLIISVRYLFSAASLGALLLENAFLAHYFSYDPLNGLYVAMGLFDGHLALAMVPLPLLLLYFDYQIRLTRRTRFYYLAYDLIVLNRSTASASYLSKLRFLALKHKCSFLYCL